MLQSLQIMDYSLFIAIEKLPVLDSRIDSMMSISSNSFIDWLSTNQTKEKQQKQDSSSQLLNESMESDEFPE